MKQRLIDANKAGAELACYHSPTGIVDEALYEFASDIINEAPTVEAIPIEWIRHYKSIYGLTYSTLFNLLETMIDDWEKENETR